MKAIVIGLGSMGKRRIRLLFKEFGHVDVVGVDATEDRRNEANDLFGIDVYSGLSEAQQEHTANCAFICTPPLTHGVITKQCLELGLHVFSEINLVSDGYDENIRLASEKNLRIFLSSTLLYRKEVQYISAKVSEQKAPLNYIYHVGQYLPDWHPWESYKNFFVNDKRSNACREIFAIELPWLIDTFGKIKKHTVSSSKNTGLDVDYHDNYMMMVEHSDGTKGLLSVDVISRKAVRNLEVFGEELYLTWDGSPTGLLEYNVSEKITKSVSIYSEVDKRSDYSHTIIEDAYSEEIKEFFQLINGSIEAPRYSFERDKTVLSLIDKIEGKNE